MDQPELKYPVCRFGYGIGMVENKKQDRRAAAFVWETGAYINRGMKVMDSNGYVYRVLDGTKGKRIWEIWDILFLRKPLYEITHSYEYLEQVSFAEAKDILKAQVLGKNYDTGRGVSRKEMAAYIDAADSFPDLFKRVNGF